MCGIAGFVERCDSPSPLCLDASRTLVHRMCDAIRHRGPDDEGVWTAAGVGLGMRRLSIIDLSTGHQPIHNEDESVWIVFNGEIYNYRELRAELEACGHRFYTATDTETIVHAYEQWGSAAIGRLRGMFGLAIWNSRDRSLLIARDRIGIKPMHYAVARDRLYFGSEIKSLLEAPDLSRDLDLDALDHYLSFLYTPRDQSIFQQVRKLPPGHLLTWKDGRLSIEQYWQLPADEAYRGSEADAVRDLRGVLVDAVRSHMISDVPLGAFLSGGVDSSMVVGLMAEASSARVKTFSIGFDVPEFDELEHARTVARHFGTDHHELVVKPDAIGILDRSVWHFDEPFADSSAIPTWYVSEMARQHVTVVLSGDGGDELFGGYDRYLPHPRVVAFDRYSPRALRRVAAMAASRLPHGVRGKNFLRHISRDDQGRYLDAIRFYSADEKESLLTPDVVSGLTGIARGTRLDPETRLARHFDRFAALPWPSQMMRFDAETYLPEDVLTKVDRMSMAHSIESRVPLLDNEVIAFASALPAALKIKHGRRKHVLKEVAATLLPPAILNRRKQGFGVPLGSWFRGGLRELFADTLLSPVALQRGYFRPAFVRRIVNEHLAGKRDHTLRLWQLVVFERWYQQYVAAERSALPLSAPAFPSTAAIGVR
jgi:asparagine synthase (glutamine-hydrolysing)